MANDPEIIGQMLRSSFSDPVIAALEQVRDSMKEISKEMREIRDHVAQTSERVARLEERNKRMDSIEEKADKNRADINDLQAEKNRRAGAAGFLETLLKWSPVIAMLLGAANALWLYGRSIGITPAPIQHIEARISPDDHTIQGQIGGRK